MGFYPYLFMGTSRTACVVEQLAHNTPLGKFFRVNIEDLIIDAGLYGKLWDMDISSTKQYISTHSWMFHTIAYNASYDVKISSPHATLGPHRHGDKAIMQLAIDFLYHLLNCAVLTELG